jgi:tetratricopeptide (TPR) repeat protein
MRIFRLALIAALALVIGCGGSTSLRSAKVYYEKNKDYPKAEEFARKAVLEEPDNWEAHIYLGQALAQQEKFSEAAEAFTNARDVAPEDKKEIAYNIHRSFYVTNYNKGITANSTMNYEEAVDFFEKAVAVMPEDAKGYVNLGVAYSMLGDTDKALEAFKTGTEADSSSSDAWRNLGITYQTLSRFIEAREAFARVVELAPDDPDGMFSLADMYFNDKEFEKALELYEQAAEIKTDDAALHYQIGATNFSLEKYIEAGVGFQKSAALAQNKDPELYKDAMFNLGVSYLKMENFDGAIATLERVLEMDESAELYDMLGAAYGKKGMKDKAMEMFQKAEALEGK